MCDAIETVNKAITILGRPGRQIKTVVAENTVARAAQERAQMPLGIEISSNVKTTRGNMINVNSHRDNIQPG